jgi:D-cysteine desulfhydrase
MARELGVDFVAHLCGQVQLPGVAENVAEITRLATRVEHYRNRSTMALRRPYLMTKRRWRGEAIIPPGATAPAGTAGFARAGIELAEQIERGELPRPDRIYIALGSCGTAVGLALGLALADCAITVCAVSAVEKIFVSGARLRAIRRGALRWLRTQGMDSPRALPALLKVDSSEVGRGYTHPTGAAERARDEFGGAGVPLETSYTGKAAAALMRDAADHPGATFLYWHTAMASSWSAPTARS